MFDELASVSNVCSIDSTVMKQCICIASLVMFTFQLIFKSNVSMFLQSSPADVSVKCKRKIKQIKTRKQEETFSPNPFSSVSLRSTGFMSALIWIQQTQWPRLQVFTPGETNSYSIHHQILLRPDSGCFTADAAGQLCVFVRFYTVHLCASMICDNARMHTKMSVCVCVCAVW